MKPSYELFDHTADMGIRVRADTLAELLTPAADGLYAVIGELTSAGNQQDSPVNITTDDAATSLRDYLDELLVLLERDGRFAVGVDAVTFSGGSLAATVLTEEVDPARSVFHREVKAITYHELAIRAIPGGCEATLIVDI